MLVTYYGHIFEKKDKFNTLIFHRYFFKKIEYNNVRALRAFLCFSDRYFSNIINYKRNYIIDMHITIILLLR